MLVRLVDGERASGSPEGACLELAHGGVDEVRRVAGGVGSGAGACPGVGEVEGRPQPERRRQARVGLEGQNAASLRIVDDTERNAGPFGKGTKRPAAAQTLLADLLPGLLGNPGEG